MNYRYINGTCVLRQAKSACWAGYVMAGRRARTRAPWGRGAPGARLRGRVWTRRRRPTRGRRPGRCGFNRLLLATALTMT